MPQCLLRVRAILQRLHSLGSTLTASTSLLTESATCLALSAPLLPASMICSMDWAYATMASNDFTVCVHAALNFVTDVGVRRCGTSVDRRQQLRLNGLARRRHRVFNLDGSSGVATCIWQCRTTTQEPGDQDKYRQAVIPLTNCAYPRSLDHHPAPMVEKGSQYQPLMVVVCPSVYGPWAVNSQRLYRLQT